MPKPTSNQTRHAMMVHPRQKKESADSRWKPFREWAGTVFGFTGIVLALISFYRSTEADKRARASQELASELQTEQTLAEAWDLLGGRPGTTVIYEFNANSGELEIARRKLQEILTHDPSNAKAQRYLAVYHDAVQDHDRALELYRRSLELDSKSPATHLNYGVALTDAGKFDQALQSFHKADKLGANSTLTLLNSGILLLEQKREEDAEKAFEQLRAQLAQRDVGLAKPDADRIRKMLDSKSYRPVYRPSYRPRFRGR